MRYREDTEWVECSLEDIEEKIAVKKSYKERYFDKTVEETIMSEKNVTDEILDILNSRAKPEIKEVVEEVEVKVKALKTTKWVEHEDGTKSRQVPFSKKFWSPKDVPDHMVTEFSGYDTIDVPDIYIPPKPEFEKLSLAFSLKLKVNVVGPTGAGKTLMMEYYAASCGRPYLRIEHNVELDKAGVFGQVHINVDEEGKQSTDFIAGVLPRSMSEPTVVILDELTRATGYSNMIYQRLLDRRELFMPEMKDAGEATLIPHSDWLICASDNTKGNGEDLEMYPMSNVQDAAFINRWDMVIEQDYLTATDEAKLIKALCPDMPSTSIKKLTKFSTLIHTGFKKGEIATAFSPRNLSTIAALVNAGVTLSEAIKMNYTSRCSKSEQSDVTECYKSAFGGK